MIYRCHVKKHKLYKHYGARGIQVCERWRNDFWVFVADVGRKPPRTSLDRINNDGPYAPENVRWATRNQQARNTRMVVVTKEIGAAILGEARKAPNGRGPGLTRIEIAEKYGCSVATVDEIRAGTHWSVST